MRRVISTETTPTVALAAALRATRPEPRRTSMSLFLTMPLPAVAAWVDHFVGLAVGEERSALHKERDALSEKNIALLDDLDAARRTIGALEINLAFERDLKISVDNDVARLRARLAAAEGRVCALEADAEAARCAYRRLDDIAQVLSRENARFASASLHSVIEDLQ